MSIIIFFLGVIGFVGLFFISGIRIVRPTERALIETLGKYSRFGSEGFNWIIPIIQRMVQVNITEQMEDIDPQVVITKDALNVTVDSVVFWKVNNDENSVKNSQYNVQNVKTQIITLAQTSARNIIGSMVFKDVNSKRKELNSKLVKELKDKIQEEQIKQKKDWGVEVVRVELKEITPTKDVQESMNRVVKANNEKEASKDFATAKETEADGTKRALIKEAEGKRQSAILEAEGKSEAFSLINKTFKGNAQLLKKLEVTENSLKDNAKIIITKEGINPQIILGDIPIKEGGIFKKMS